MSVLVVCFAALVSCNSNTTSQQQKTTTEKDSTTLAAMPAEAKTSLPFIGKRDFETRHAFSGTGTPHRYVEIKKNGEVFFSFEQENQATDEVTSEIYYAGKFAKYMNCVFKKLDNDTMYYEITNNAIYEVDQNNNRLTNEDCCSNNNFDMGDKCPCEYIFDDVN